MSLWFVYSGMEYYPFHDIIEAETAEDAAAALTGEEPIAVFPLDSLAYRRDWELGTAWLEPEATP